MDELVQSVQLDDVVDTYQLQCDWELATASDTLLRQLYAEEPWIQPVYEFLRSNCPAANTVKSFMSPIAVRPNNHQRCFYIDSCRLGGVDSDGGVLAVKGSEIRANDLGVILRRLGQRSDSLCMSGLEHFPCVEQKIPGAVTLDEAQADAHAAFEFQLAHLQRFGELAHIPVPLFVFRWPEEYVASFRSQLYPLLTDRVKHAVGRLLSTGLGCYIYYYPAIPLRANNIASYISGGGNAMTYADRVQLLRERIDPEEVIDDWLELVVRILALGYSPVTLSHPHTGHCVSAQNAVVDGGFVDVDSLQRVDELQDDRDLTISLALTLRELVGTFSQLMAPPTGFGSASYRFMNGPELTAISVAYFIRTKLSLLIAEAEQRHGLTFDPRIRRFFSWPYSFSDLDEFFRMLEPDHPTTEKVIT